MTLIRIDRNPTRRQLALFAALWLAFFAAAGLGAFCGGRGLLAAALWFSAGLVPLSAWAAPRLLRLVYIGTACLAFPIGFAVSYILLAVVFYLVLTPVGLLMRVLGYDPMNRRRDAHATTYWTPRPAERGEKDYFRQF